MEQENTAKATWLEIIRYGCGGAGVSTMLNLLGTYLIFFLTDQAKVQAAAAGTVFLTAKLIDIVTYPTLGVIADRNVSRWGRYRPFIIFGMPITAVFLILMFTVPNLPAGSKVIYYAVVIFLFSIICATVVLPYQALVPIISEDPTQRNILVTAREMTGLILSNAAMAAVVPITKYFGNNPAAWQKMIIIYAVFIAIMMYIAQNGARKHDICLKNTTVRKEDRQKTAIKDQLKVLSTNDALARLAVTFAALILASVFAATSSMYFFTYVIGKPFIMTLVSLLIIPCILGLCLIIPLLLKKFGKKNVFLANIFANIVTTSILFIFRPFSNMTLLTITIVVWWSIAGPIAVIAGSLVPDCYEYGIWKTRIRGAALITSVISLSSKLMTALGGFLIGVAMSAVGYIAGKVQPPQVNNMIIILMTLVPLVLCIIAFITMKGYPITEEVYTIMKSEIKAMERDNENNI